MALIELTPNLESSLYWPLKKSFEAKKVNVSEETAFYINNLLAGYITSPDFDSDKPLASMVLDALYTPEKDDRLHKFVAIGDYSFFMSSVFQGHVNRNFGPCSRVYCIRIGSNSYLEAC